MFHNTESVCVLYCTLAQEPLVTLVTSTQQSSSSHVQVNILFAKLQISLINPLVLELDIYSLAHHLCKMWIFYEPGRVTLGNTRHFVEE